MTPKLDIETIERVFANAFASASFERLGTRRGLWDVSLDCENPVPVVMHSRATGSVKKAIDGRRIIGIEMILKTPCRRCGTCLRKKARLWRYRALAEIQVAPRTWFGTLNTTPDFDVRMDHAAATTCRDFWSLPSEKKFAPRVREMGKEVTKYLKRVRKNSGCPFRYLLVSEQHNSEDTSDWKRGRPHFHMLVHEYPSSPVRKHFLDDAWHHGFSQWRLTRNQEAAWYVSKYITKSNDARVRASLGYGSPPLIEVF